MVLVLFAASTKRARSHPLVVLNCLSISSCKPGFLAFIIATIIIIIIFAIRLLRKQEVRLLLGVLELALSNNLEVLMANSKLESWQ